MEKKTAQEPLWETRDQTKEPPRRAEARVAFPLHSIGLWTAGIPFGELPEEAALELASKLGNGAMCALLDHRGCFETAPFHLEKAGELPVNPIQAAPPETADPSGLRLSGFAGRSFAPTRMTDRAALSEGMNLFGIGGGEL